MFVVSSFKSNVTNHMVHTEAAKATKERLMMVCSGFLCVLILRASFVENLN